MESAVMSQHCQSYI